MASDRRGLKTTAPVFSCSLLLQAVRPCVVGRYCKIVFLREMLSNLENIYVILVSFAYDNVQFCQSGSEITLRDDCALPSEVFRARLLPRPDPLTGEID